MGMTNHGPKICLKRRSRMPVPELRHTPFEHMKVPLQHMAGGKKK